MSAYPEARERETPPSATLTDRFRAPDVSGGAVTVGDDWTELWRFGGSVARIKVLVLDQDAQLRFHCRGRGASRPLLVPAGAEWDEGVAAEVVEARNNVAGQTARAQVTGYYA